MASSTNGHPDGSRGAQITSTGTPVSDALGRVIFAPDANENGSPYATFQFTVTDDGTTNGVADPKTSGAATVTVNVTRSQRHTHGQCPNRHDGRGY